MTAAPVLDLEAPLVIGFGATGRAVAQALIERGHRPLLVEDRPTDDHRAAADQLGLPFIEGPDETALGELVGRASVLLPSPGIPDHHPVFALARRAGLGLASEFDLAQAWDQRPLVAVTGTNGKTTVTMMVTEALERSGRSAKAVGNTDVPFVEAIADPTTQVFVVEASSFRLGHSARFQPQVAGWLNFAPDHLDAHATLEIYEEAKASIWANLEAGATAVVNADDPVVASRAGALAGREIDVRQFSIAGLGPRPGPGPGGNAPVDWRVEAVDGRPHLFGPVDQVGGEPLLAVDQLARQQPHDVANALATAALALPAGATVDGIVDTIRDFRGLPHRLELVGSWDGVAWYNDSKATVPHATVVAVGGFDSVVLIAGGHPKGLSFEPLGQTVPPVRGVVAIGEAAPQIDQVFADLAPVQTATSMDDAIAAAQAMAKTGDTVVLSPACASFDWYANYEARGDDFRRRVRTRFGEPGDGRGGTGKGSDDCHRLTPKED